MKRVFFLTLFLFAVKVFSFAQTYQPMAIENAHWIIYNGIYTEWDIHGFVVRGDTTIDNLMYKKLFYQDFAEGGLEPPYTVEDEFLWGVIRDDTLDRKVYVIAFEPYDPEQPSIDYSYKCPLYEEQLLYDFSAAIGDTIGQCLAFNNYSTAEPSGWIVDSIASEMIYGEERRTLYSYNGELVPAIHEGIGSSMNGLLGGISIGLYLNINYSGFGLLSYCVGADIDCSIVSRNRDVLFPENQFQLFPNPAHQEVQLNITSPMAEDLEFQVYNVFGQLVLKTGIPKNQTVQSISLMDLPKGLYKYVLTTGGADQVVGSGSFVRG
jgi:hypothetical protein